jgi:hypothetical protein
MPFLVRATSIRAADGFVGPVGNGAVTSKQGKQKCLMYATNFVLRASEPSDPQKLPISAPSHWRQNDQASK